MLDYLHTQIGTVTLGVLGAGILIVGAILLARGSDALLLAVLLILVVTAGLFATLTVEIHDGLLTVWFGPGLVRKRVSLAAIRTCTVVRNPWWYGWGIRWTPRGWLYNVSGLTAVELSLTNGQRLRIGTDQPEQLCQAIVQACTAIRI
jgi:hypothetical protein